MLLVCLEKMICAKLMVLLLTIRAVQCIEPEVCSKYYEVFRGIARDRHVISNSKAVKLDVSKLSSVCDAGVYCREFCLVDSMEWNFFEVKKVSLNHSLYMPFRSHQGERCAVVTKLQKCHLSITCHFGIMDSSMRLEVNIFRDTIIIQIA